MSVRPFVSFGPGMRSGDATINGSRLSVEAVLNAIWHDGLSAKDAAELWAVEREDVITACWFAGTYGVTGWSGSERTRVHGGQWRKRFGAWAFKWHPEMWNAQWDLVPDPPSRHDDEADA